MLDLESLELFPLEGPAPYGFRCKREEQNSFFYERAWPEQQQGFSLTYLAHLSGIVVGYMTVAMDAIPLQTREKPHSSIGIVRFPALKLAQLAVHVNWEGQGVGKHLVALAAGLGLDLRQRVGCRYLTVDAEPDLTDWYEKQEFRTNRLVQKELEERAAVRQVSVAELPRSMRLDLFSLLADLQDRYPRDFPRE